MVKYVFAGKGEKKKKEKALLLDPGATVLILLD